MMAEYEFFSTQEVHEGETYKHVLMDKTLYIYRDGEEIAKLNDTDVMRMLEALGLHTVNPDLEKGLWK